jgi:hypothetical protein
VGLYGAGLYGAGLYGFSTSAALIAVSPTSLVPGSGATTIAFVGSGTTWLSAAPVITASAGSLGARTATSDTTATATYTPPSTAQNVTFTDSTDSNTTAVMSIAPLVVIPAQVAGMPPQLVVEVSFATNPADPPIWVDITKYVERLTINRGRQRELDQVQAGVCTLDLENRDRRFDPTYVSGPYYPNVLPMRRLRVRATYNNTSFPLYSGYVESWGQHWNTWQDAIVPVTAADAFKVLNLAQLNTSFPVETSDQRVNDVLNTINWTVGGAAWIMGTSILGTTTILGPTGDRVVSPGSSTIQASVLADTSALQHLQDVTDTEMGLLFTDRVGAVTFYGRGHATNTTSAGTFGEAAGEMPYVDIQLAYDDTQIWNDARVTPQGGTQQTGTDLASQAQYYVRTLSKTSTLHNSDAEALGLAQALVVRFAQPSLQIISMTLDGEANPSVIYPEMLGRDLGERVTVRRRPVWGGMIEQISDIQGISIDYAAEGGVWSVTWRLTPADTSTYWVLGDPVKSKLATTTTLFF